MRVISILAATLPLVACVMASEGAYSAGTTSSSSTDAGAGASTSGSNDANDASPGFIAGDAGTSNVNASDAANADEGGDPFSVQPTCTSGSTWALGTVGSPDMEPGMACGSCHFIGGQASKYPFDIAGTVYPTAHEPDLCNGASNATVVITDANGTDHSLTVSTAGNFYNLDYLGVGAIATPYTAKVVVGGSSRAMLTPQTVGDCNSCHTQSGTQSAQGRILLP